jgi:gliding motility-associated-like protein
MKKGPLHSFLILTFMLLLATSQVLATHNRAGELTYAFIAPNTIQVTIATWTKASSILADRDTLAIHWGDGSPDEVVPRINGPIDLMTGVPSGVLIGNDTKYNLYVGQHVYPGAPPPPNSFFVVSLTDPNRNIAIINIDNSVNVQFYIEDTIFYPSNIQNVGFDRSPICLNPPIDFAYIGDTFFHNPAAYDPDGDSISFRMIIPLQYQGAVVPGYHDPTFYPTPNSPNDVESLDVHTGMYTWATPQRTGLYNVAFLISEYRRGFLLGTIDRDMQILVLVDTTSPPVVHIPRDTCVRAGDPLIVAVSGTDPNHNNTVTLTGYGGPLAGDPAIFPDSLSPASFTNGINGSSLITGNPAEGVFRWNTVCLDIRQQPYQIVFKAENNNVNPKVDLKTWNIEVIAPPPLNLTDTIQTKHVQLHWQNPYKCDSIHTFRGFSVWRRVGSNPFIPEYCETGLAGRGYTMIANKIFDTTYTDLTAVHGENLCYRILAHFSEKSPNGLYDYDAVVSVPSNEYCIYLPSDVPIITTASVERTDSIVGKMFVAWTKPRTGGTNLDTILSPPPYRFDLYRGKGFTFVLPSLIQSYSSNTFAGLNDTIFVDTHINTADSAYSYKVVFYSNTDTVGATNLASSVYLSTYASDNKIRLSWNFNVPWLQDSFQIFRQGFNTGPAFQYVATDTIPTKLAFIDTGLVNDSTYCYYVKAFGHYTSPFIGQPLVDSSEIKCATPIDTIPPCPPVVTVTNDCGTTLCDTCFQYINNLTWQESDSCGFTTVKYHIYYASDSVTAPVLIATIPGGPGTYSYAHTLNGSLAGCYIVTAVDKRGVESYKVNQVCIEDCPNYDLPNTFTPNGDGFNDYFTPYHPYRFITRVDFKIFTRWGEKVYETTNPEIMWDGKDQKTGKDLSDGVYLYAGYYYEKTLSGEVRKTLPHKNGGGFIHLIRGK